jgi:hypothetical protein
MAVFQYPKTKHVRTLAPAVFKRYRTYKRYLQTEFSRVCVYCRQPDTSAPNLNFGVDHYRPKGILRFASLVCSYTNLFYCCGDCNSRKNNYWPLNEKSDPYIVNPCDHEMSAHLSFNKDTGEITPKTPFGDYTEQLLQLNDSASVAYRIETLYAIKILGNTITALQSDLKTLANSLAKGNISNHDYDREVKEIRNELNLAEKALQRQNGEVPLAPLKKKRFGVALIP